MTPLRKSNVVLMARVDDPVQQLTLATFSTIVEVEHGPDEPTAGVVEMAIEIAPAVSEWGLY